MNTYQHVIANYPTSRIDLFFRFPIRYITTQTDLINKAVDGSPKLSNTKPLQIFRQRHESNEDAQENSACKTNQ